MGQYLSSTHHLKLRTGNVPYDNGIQEYLVKVLWHKEFEVFSNENPRPKDALMGNEAVMEYLGLD